jgi:hypothetical protein
MSTDSNTRSLKLIDPETASQPIKDALSTSAQSADALVTGLREWSDSNPRPPA